MKTVLLLLIVGFITSQTFCQPQYAPLTFTSPNSASLGKYGQIPVSLFTGLPEIAIPLYEIKEGDLVVPITLSYHASGIKVEEKASSVGLGWTLNAGGV